MDVRHFLDVLLNEADNVTNISLALVGYGLSDTGLGNILNAQGLQITYATTDLHVAAKWRNDPTVHTNIIALAKGRHPGVSTLAHFPQGNSREFAKTLLAWAQGPQAALASTPAQERLLAELANDNTLSPLLSLNGIAEFLAAWKLAQAKDELDAPRSVLPRLGILPDRHLLDAADSVAQRLKNNFDLTQELVKMPGHRFEMIRMRLKDQGPDQYTKKMKTLENIEKLRRTGTLDVYSALDYEDALGIIKPPNNSPSVPKKEPSNIQQPSNIRDSRDVSRDGGEQLIDDNYQALEKIVKQVREALSEAVDGDEDTATGSYRVNGCEHQFTFEIDREFLTCIRYFCSNDVWGGFFETKNASLIAALHDYRQCEPTRFRPETKSIAYDGNLYDLRSVIEEMQKALHQSGVTMNDFCRQWDCIVEARKGVLQFLDLLIHQPMLGIAGASTLRDKAGDLIQSWEAFYAKLALYHGAMHEIDHAWTRMLFEAVVSLDVVQIKTNREAGKYSWKAILLPTHPLHLWRYERMSSLARGLKPEKLDREAILKQLEQPEHYLGVLYLSSFPAGKGGDQPLPVARDYRGLAVFENLRNAYSGDDGLETLQRCVRQFAQIYVNHTEPLRLALVNPPNASRMLMELLKGYGKRQDTQARLLVHIYATQDHEARLQIARRFSTADRDQIEEHVASGRLQLRIHNEVMPLNEILSGFHDKPVHILAVFDEATTAMRQQPSGTSLLPMSPFAIRRRIGFQGIRRKVELLPSMEESVFRSFYDMVGKLKDSQPGQTPQASADAELMRRHIERTLIGQKPGGLLVLFCRPGSSFSQRSSCSPDT